MLSNRGCCLKLSQDYKMPIVGYCYPQGCSSGCCVYIKWEEKMAEHVCVQSVLLDACIVYCYIS